MAQNVVRVQVEHLGIIAIPAKAVAKLAESGILVFGERTGWVMDTEFSDMALAIPGAAVMSRTRESC